MKHTLALVFTLVLSASLVFSQNTDPVLLTVGNDKITLSEFEQIFKKNNTDKKVDKEALDEYIDLFTKFRLKVKQAKDQGMDTTKAFTQELLMYRKQLSQPYLKVTDVEEKLVKEAYDRFNKDVKIRHILIRLPQCAAPKDTLEAYKKLEAIRKDILKNKNFEEAAAKYSQDTITAPKGGLLGYFTALQTAYAFENAYSAMKAGDVSQIVRTSQGYHLLKVDDVRPARGLIQVAHIFIGFDKNNAQSYAAAKQKIEEVYQRLQSGDAFDNLAREYSDDYNTAQKGGELAPFGINRMQPVFEDAAFALKTPGEYSKPFEGPYGFHILKLMEKKGVPEFDVMKNELQKEISKTKRWEVVKQTLINNTKVQYKYELNKDVLTRLETISVKNNGNLSKEEVKNLPVNWLFKLDGKTYSYQDFTESALSKVTADKPLEFCNFSKNYLDPYIDNIVLEYKESNLENEDPRFRGLMSEYRDGILLFNLMDKRVWTKSVEDTTGLKAFYETHKNNYMWGERADAYVIDCLNADVEKQARKLASKLQTGKISKAKFIEQLNKKNNSNIILSEGMYSKGDNTAVDNTGWKAGIGSSVDHNGRIRFAVVKSIVPPQPKALKEAKGLIISDYQAYLENQWIEELRGKYQVNLNKDVLYSLIGK